MSTSSWYRMTKFVALTNLMQRKLSIPPSSLHRVNLPCWWRKVSTNFIQIPFFLSIILFIKFTFGIFVRNSYVKWNWPFWRVKKSKSWNNAIIIKMPPLFGDKQVFFRLFKKFNSKKKTKQRLLWARYACAHSKKKVKVFTLNIERKKKWKCGWQMYIKFHCFCYFIWCRYVEQPSEARF